MTHGDGRSNNFETCTKCGRLEHAELLDGKIDRETQDTIGVECIACYGDGWAPTATDSFQFSVCPDLSPLYAVWRDRMGGLMTKAGGSNG